LSCDGEQPSYKLEYPSFEHALLASKLSDFSSRARVIEIEGIPEVKRFVSGELKRRSLDDSDWKSSCLSTAERLLRDKFMRNKAAKAALVSTGKKSLR
jgi:predicted NAD-dependent protein-ADP-ribosyltransferase YbiA (DUF1768 family)